MKQNGFIENFLVNEEKHKIRVFLRYVKNRQSILNGLESNFVAWRTQICEISGDSLRF